MAEGISHVHVPSHSKGQTTCHHHRERQLELYCETCQELACLRCLSSVHKGHIFYELSEITPTKKQDITSFVDRTEQNELVQIQTYIASTDSLLQDNYSAFDKLSQEVKAQNEKLKQELDMLTAETISIYQKMKEDNDKVIANYKQELTMYKKQLEEQLQGFKTVLQRGSHIEIYDIECKLDPEIHLPDTPVLGDFGFTTNKTPRNDLKLALGNVETSCQGHSITDPPADGNTSGQGQITTKPDDQQQAAANHAGLKKKKRRTYVVKSKNGGFGLTTNKTPRNNLKVALGNLETSCQGHSITDPLADGDTSGQGQIITGPDKQQQATTHQQLLDVETKIAESRSVLLPKTKDLGHLHYTCSITSLCCVGINQAWTTFRNTLSFLHIDDCAEAIVKQKVVHTSRINDISVSPRTHTLWACDDNKGILELVSETLVHRFSTTDTPSSICATSTNHIIIGMSKHISKFTTEGHMVVSTSTSGIKPKETCSQHWIAECPVTGNVAVISYTTDGHYKIVIMNSDFKELFVCHEDTHLYYRRDRDEFSPMYVAYDSVGNVLIGEWRHSRITVRNGRGDVLCTFKCHNNWDGKFYLGKHPSVLDMDRINDGLNAFCLDSDDIVWAVCHNCEERIIGLQYKKIPPAGQGKAYNIWFV
ncbi:uncharacterized protein [Argopecten irradians]|uniref:uncharacterized protein isoform X2 n=1 Tax=Argopecten irradians TaxID=31199 RepID=UPI00371FBF85